MMDHAVVRTEDEELDLPSPAIIKVVGCGGGGSSAVQRMIEAGIDHVEFIVVNTDLQALNKSTAKVKVPIGRNLTGGLGAGGNPETGRQAAEEDREKIKEKIAGADMVFVTAGMGGGTGTGSAPIVAEIAKELGALTVGVVTTPFNFEGPVRMQYAVKGVEELKKHVDSLIVIPNEKLYQMADPNERLTFKKAFAIADSVLQQGIRGIVSIIMESGDINTDFADVKATMLNRGEAMLGIGVGHGPDRAMEAATNAINNPLLEDVSIKGAKVVLINIVAKEIGVLEGQQISSIVCADAHPDHQVYFGLVEKEDMDDDELAVTVIATGFDTAPDSYIPADKAFPKTASTENIVSIDEFENLLGSGAGSFVSPKNPSGQAADTDPLERTLGSDIRTAARRSSVVPPRDLNGDDDNKERPACWRKYSGNLSNTIELRDDPNN